jgi:hypothetical protein
MWLAVNCERMVLANDSLSEEIKEFGYDEWDNDYYPNAIIFRDKTDQIIRLTTSQVYPVYFLIQHYRRSRRVETEGDYSEASDIDEEKLEEEEKKREEKKE